MMTNEQLRQKISALDAGDGGPWEAGYAAAVEDVLALIPPVEPATSQPLPLEIDPAGVIAAVTVLRERPTDFDDGLPASVHAPLIREILTAALGVSVEPAAVPVRCPDPMGIGCTREMKLKCDMCDQG